MDGTARLAPFSGTCVRGGEPPRARPREPRSSLTSSITALSLGFLAFACGGGSEDARPPTTPAQQQKAPSTEAPPVEANSTAAPTDAAPLAPSPGDGAWPFVSVFSKEDREAQLERLKKDPGPIKSNWVPPGKSERYGHAEGLISAPVDAVRAKLRDFTRYKDLAGPKFKSVKVVDKQGQNTDVYFQLPIMRGMVTIWYVTRFPPARQAFGGDVLEGTFVKGNIKGMHIAFTVRPGTEEKNSILVCDLILRPSVPAPQSALDEELRDACGDAINSLRKTISANP